MTDVVVGLDAGGSKLAIRIETLDGRRLVDAELVAEEWDAEPVERSVGWLLGHLGQVMPDDARIVALGLGAQGCDSPEVAAGIERGLEANGIPSVVVNDAALLVPAVGVTVGIGIIAGTGAIAVGVSSDGEPLAAGGWGWVLGDDAGAVGIVREAVKAALTAHDSGLPDDGLLETLLREFTVQTAERLARAVNDEPTIENWAPHAKAVFSAADAGSALAVGVIDRAGEHLAVLVDQLRSRGAVGDTVVAAGSVIARQPRLSSAVAERLAARHPELAFVLLDDAPVAGGIVLARRDLERRAQADAAAG